MFFVRAVQRTGARHSHCVIAASAAAAAAGIKKIEPAVVLDHKRSFHHGAFPGRVVANEFLHFTRQFGSVVTQALDPNNRWEFAAVAVFLPKEITLALLVIEWHGVDRARRLRHHYAVVRIRPAWLFRGRRSHRKRSALLPCDI